MLCTFLGLSLSLTCYGQQEYRKTVEGFSTAYAQHDLDQARAYLSPDFAVGIYGRSHEKFLWNTFTQHFSCDSILYIGELGSDQAEVMLYPTKRPNQKTIFTFDEQGLIRHIAAFDAMYQIDREAPSQLLHSIPFEEQNGSIILKCRINDSPKELRLLFDTGADGMAVSTTLAKELGLTVNRSNSASVVGGNVQIEVSENNTVHIGDFVFPRQGIALFPNMAKNTDGIIGNTLVKHYIVKVDYDEQLLHLYSMGKHDFGDKGSTLPLELGSNIHLPLSITMGGGKTYHGEFYFDTGASYSLILFRPFVLANRLLVDGFKPLTAGTTVSMGLSTPTFTGLAEKVQIGETLQTDDFLITLMGGSDHTANWKPDADGSLGVGLIGRYNFTIDLLNKRMHLEPNNRHQLPSDFVLQDHVFHFDLEQNVYIGKVMDGAGIFHRIRAINGDSIDTWGDKMDLCDALQRLIKRRDIRIEAEQSGAIKEFFLNRTK